LNCLIAELEGLQVKACNPFRIWCAAISLWRRFQSNSRRSIRCACVLDFYPRFRRLGHNARQLRPRRVKRLWDLEVASVLSGSALKNSVAKRSKLPTFALRM